MRARRLTAALALPMLWALLAVVPSTRAADDDEAFAWRATIAIERPAAFVELPLDLATYAHLEQPDLADLRIVDARGRRVPFAVLAPLRPARAAEVHDGRLYPWPARGGTAGAGTASAPWTVELQDNRVVVRGTGGEPPPAAGSPGWLIDTRRERLRSADASATSNADVRDLDARTLTFAWQGPAEFTAAYSLESSDDLATWREAGGGQLLSLSSGGDTLAQRAAALPEGHGRFVRLLWRDPASAPRLTGVQVSMAVDGVATTSSRDTTTRVEVSAMPPIAPAASDRAGPAASSAISRSIDFDLGAVLPLGSVELLLPEGNWVAPIVIQTREAPADRWAERARTVVYRLERPVGAQVSAVSGGMAAPGFSQSPPILLDGAARYVRVVTDARVAALDAAGTRLAAQARLARLVFAAQGSPPFAIVAGLPRAPAIPAALPVGTLLPSLATERTSFGTATVGAWTEVEAIREHRRKERDDAARQAVLRPLLLWTVLIAGVAGLGFMAWRLMRPGQAGRRDD